MSIFIVETKGKFNKDESHLENIETHFSHISPFIKALEVQMGQLTTELKSQKKGKFPSDTEHNLREQCQAIMLRSGKEVQPEKPKVVEEKEVRKRPKLSKILLIEPQ